MSSISLRLGSIVVILCRPLKSYRVVNTINMLFSKRHRLQRKEVNKGLISEPGDDFVSQCCRFGTISGLGSQSLRGAGRVDRGQSAPPAVEGSRQLLLAHRLLGGL